MDQDRQDLERELLLLRCQRGDRSAFEELIRSWERRLHFYIRRLVANEEDAWDVLQTVWVDVVRGVNDLRDPRRLPVWLYSIARNKALSHHRRAYVRDRVHESRRAASAQVDDRCRLETADFIRHGLSRLSEGDREVLTLFFLRDLSVNEAADVLGIPPGTVKSRLHKARKSLREILEREGVRNE
jgi:RNA polymerase sigma-70 factor (ECF subfamily)